MPPRPDKKISSAPTLDSGILNSVGAFLKTLDRKLEYEFKVGDDCATSTMRYDPSRSAWVCDHVICDDQSLAKADHPIHTVLRGPFGAIVMSVCPADPILKAAEATLLYFLQNDLDEGTSYPFKDRGKDYMICYDFLEGRWDVIPMTEGMADEDDFEPCELSLVQAALRALKMRKLPDAPDKVDEVVRAGLCKLLRLESSG